MASEIRYRRFQLNLDVDYMNFNPGTYEKLKQVKKKDNSSDNQNQERRSQAINGQIYNLKNGKFEKSNIKSFNADAVTHKASVNSNSRLLTKRNSEAGILKHGKSRKLKATADKLIKSKSFGNLSIVGTDDETNQTAAIEYTTNFVNEQPEKTKFGENEESVYEELDKVDRDHLEPTKRGKIDQPFKVKRDEKRKHVTIKEPVYDELKEFQDFSRDKSNNNRGKPDMKKKSNLPVIEKLCDLHHVTVEKQTQALKKVSDAHKQLNHMSHEKSVTSRLVTKRNSNAGIIQQGQGQMLLKRTPDKLVKSKTCPDFSKPGVHQKGYQMGNTKPKPVTLMQELHEKLKQRAEANSDHKTVTYCNKDRANKKSDQGSNPNGIKVSDMKQKVVKERGGHADEKPPIVDPLRRSGIPRPLVKVNSDAVNFKSRKSQLTNAFAEKTLKSKSWADFAKYWEQNKVDQTEKSSSIVVKEESIYDSLGKYDRRNFRGENESDQNDHSQKDNESDSAYHKASECSPPNNEISVGSRLIRKRNSDAGVLKHNQAEVANPAKIKLVRAKTFASFSKSEEHENSLQTDDFNISSRKHGQTGKQYFVEHVYESLPDIDDNLSNNAGLGKTARVRFYCPSDEIDEESKQSNEEVSGLNHLYNGKPSCSRLRTKRTSDAGILKHGKSEILNNGADALVKSKSFGSFSQIKSQDNTNDIPRKNSDCFTAGFSEKNNQNVEDIYDDLADFRRDSLRSVKKLGSDGISFKNGFVCESVSEAQKEIDNIYGNLQSVDLERLRQVLKLNANAVIFPDKYLKLEDDKKKSDKLSNGYIDQLKGDKRNPSLLGKILSECQEFLDQGGKYMYNALCKREYLGLAFHPQLGH